MQRLNHHHLYVFFIFAKNLSFTKTAQQLLIAQSAVTSQVKQLEQTLNLELVDRTYPRKPQLTEAGHKVAEYADSIFESSRELINWATSGALPKKRMTRIGAISGLSRNFQYEFIEPLVNERNMKFEITTGDQENLLRQLGDHQLDVVLTSKNATTDSKINFHSHVIKTSPLVIVKKKKSGSRDLKNLDQLISENSIYIPGRNFEAKPELDAYLDKFKSIHIAGEVDDTALLRVLAIKSDSAVVIPEMGIINEIISKEVTVVARLNKVIQKFYAITRQRRDPNPDVRFLIDRAQKK